MRADYGSRLTRSDAALVQGLGLGLTHHDALRVVLLVRLNAGRDHFTVREFDGSGKAGSIEEVLTNQTRHSVGSQPLERQTEVGEVRLCLRRLRVGLR